MIEIISDRQTFISLGKQWDRLAEQFETPLLGHEWFLSSIKAFHQGDTLHVVLIREAEEIVAAAPLVLLQRNGIPRLELMGTAHLHEPCGLLYRDEEALTRLVNILIELKYPLVLERIGKEDFVLSFFKKKTTSKGLVFHRIVGPSPLISCDTSWVDFYSSISSRRRYDHRRARRRAEKAGELRFEICHPTRENYSQLMDQAFRIEGAGWKKRHGSALLSDQGLRQFYLEYCGYAAEKNMLRLFFLYIDGQAAAMQICLDYAHRLWVLKIGYDEEWSSCSPGVLLMNSVIEHAFKKEKDYFEFLGSSESWLEVWANGRRDYLTLAYYPFSLPGFLGFGRDLLQVGSDRLKKRLPQRLVCS